MDPISTVLTCLSVLQRIYDLREEIKGNISDCHRLLDRTQVFRSGLVEIQAKPSLYKLTSEPAYKALCASLNRTVEFGQKFLQPTYYQTLVNVTCRKSHAQDIAKLNQELTACASDLELIQNIDFELRRREDIEDANACFQYCVDSVLKEISQLGEQSADQFAQLQADIEDNKQFLKEMVSLLGHRPLISKEQAKTEEGMDAMKSQVERCHREVMDALEDEWEDR
jgi:hypothetical protein